MLANDISRCVGRRALSPDAPICERREQCARYVALLEQPEGPVHSPVAMHLCTDTDDFMVEIRYTITEKGRAMLEGKK